MTIKDKILAAIKQSNPLAINLLPEDITIGLLTVLSNDTKNTQVTLTAAADSGYVGSINVKYNRRNLNTLNSNLTFYSTTSFTQEYIVSKINETCNTEFVTTDFLSFTIPSNNQGIVQRIQLIASATNYLWFGSVYISTIRGNNNQTSNESVLFAISELDNKFDHFFEITEIVNSVGGYSGIVTKEMLGIDLIDNTPDLQKPVSLLTKAALDNKADASSIYLVRSNISNDDLFLGNVVYALNNTIIDKAVCTNENKLSAIGLVCDDLILSQNGIGRVQTTGILKGTFEQWFVVTGMVGGLVPNKKYFLDNVSGRITPNLPSDALAVCSIGKAVSQTEFSINIETIINL